MTAQGELARTKKKKNFLKQSNSHKGIHFNVVLGVNLK